MTPCRGPDRQGPCIWFVGFIWQSYETDQTDCYLALDLERAY